MFTIHKAPIMSAVFAACGFVAATSLVRADVYFVCPIEDLQASAEVEAGSTDGRKPHYGGWWRSGEVQSYGTVSGGGEIYVSPSADSWFVQDNTLSTGGSVSSCVAIRLPTAKEVTGTVFIPNRDFTGLKAFKFSVDVHQWSEDRQKDYLRIKLIHYEYLTFRPRPGAAWFRHQVRETQKQLAIKLDDGTEPPNRFGRSETMLERTYAMASGGRAVSENLQLDRFLPQAAAEVATVDLSSLEGIKVKSFDWMDLNQDAQPKRDSLAAAIPQDQYAIFAPSFAAFVSLADTAGRQGELFLRAAEPQAENAKVRERYERQLGIGLNQFARKLGPALIKSVAITGADPYLRTGADLAVLFAANDANVLRDLLKTQIELAVASNPNVHQEHGVIEGIAYRSYRTPDRAVCSYLAVLGEVAVVTNSHAQLRQLVSVHQGKLPSLNSLGEYTFFRNRYPLGENEEAGLLLLSDDTIRKWCSPRWRIATSRRTRAAALMAELQAAHLDQLVREQVSAGPLHTDLASADMGEFTLGPLGVQSSVYGTLEFLTPILELEFDKVTQTEASFYQRWREGYERNWSAFFDPIAVQFRVTPDKLGADLTVMPLIEFSDYRIVVGISKGAKLTPESGDPHPESILHAVLALNLESELLSRQANLATTFTRVNPLQWLGPSAALYIDNDPLWAEFPKLSTEKEIRDFVEENIYRLPIALHFEVSNSFQLIAFLTGMRAFIDQATPGMTVWETFEYNEQPYVKVSSAQAGKGRNAWDKIALYYRANGNALTLTLNEDLLKRAIDRQIARDNGKSKGQDPPPVALPWLGENFCVTIDTNAFRILQAAFGDLYQRQMQRLAWANLPILNEWHDRYPGQDPEAIHEKFWQRKLVCPGGGEYRWNEAWHTVESTIYGHPGEPKQGDGLPPALRDFTSCNFGQTFEENGLRVRIEVQRRSQTEESQTNAEAP